jgi:putative Holliday junction resolvase
MRTLAIDFGTRRVGLALSDAGGKLATPYQVLTVTDPAQAIEPILHIIQTEDVQRVVIGLPLNMDGTHGPAAKTVVEFGRSLANHGAMNIIYVDERLSSFQAEQDVTNRRREGEKITRKSKKQRLDALAAALFLQEFLDGKLAEIEM